MELSERIRLQVLTALGKGKATQNQLYDVLLLFSKYRSYLLQNTLVVKHGATVQSGPFAGMDYLPGSSEGCHIPKLLGCYERELHPYIEAVVDTSYDAIVNIGCAEGYYAVGLAKRCPAGRVYAFDADPNARDACRALAERNGVTDRVVVSGIFESGMFRSYADRRTLVIIDIEGNEKKLFDGVTEDDVDGIDFLIECHDCFDASTSAGLGRLFESRHRHRIIRQSLLGASLPSMFDDLGHLDHLLAVWEWRKGPTPWILAASNRWPDSPFATSLQEVRQIP